MSKKSENINPLFNRVYSSYYNTVHKIINSSSFNIRKDDKGNSVYCTNDADINYIIFEEILSPRFQPIVDDNDEDNNDEDDAYNPCDEVINSKTVEIIDQLVNSWHLFQNSTTESDQSKTKKTQLETRLSNIVRPPTTLEKQWLTTVSYDPRFKLFADPEALRNNLGNLQPLPKNAWCPFDVYQNGDAYLYDEQNKDYKKEEAERFAHNIKKIIEAIREKRALDFKYHGNNPDANGNYDIDVQGTIPLRLEYSHKNDKFRLLAYTKNTPYLLGFYNLSNFKNCCTLQSDPIATEELNTAKDATLSKRQAVIKVIDARNALQRAMLDFSDYEKGEVRLLEEKCTQGLIYEHEAKILKQSGKEVPASFDIYEITLRYPAADEAELRIRILGMGHLVKVTQGDSLIRIIKERLRTQASLNAARATSKTNADNNKDKGKTSTQAQKQLSSN